jgi:Ser/Thr protein kinase RdoA (MazF antagonist)
MTRDPNDAFSPNSKPNPKLESDPESQSRNAWGDETTRFFFELTPDRVLDAVEAAGLRCTGRCMALNSFENRVYDVELESDEGKSRVVVKFYRPGRWTSEQILEEHEFLRDLKNAEIPAIAPLPFPDASPQAQATVPGAAGPTLRSTPSGIWYSLFPKVGGRAPDEFSDEQLLRIGRLLARVHGVGASKPAPHRIRINPATYGWANLEYLLKNWVPAEYAQRYGSTVRSLLSLTEPWFASAPQQRLHGDCHPGNLLLNGEGHFFFLDFDDMVVGPPVQDVWLLVPGRDNESKAQREVLLEGYAEMRAFDRSTLRLLEPLRALRFIHYTAWIARRWADPAFPAAFPEFGSHAYWADETADLEEQLRVIRAQ